MLEYQKTGRYFGMIAEDLKLLGEKEILKLGATELKEAYRGLFFKCDFETLCKINYQSRFFSRIMAPLLSFDCHSDKYLYHTARSIDWSRFITPDNTFAVFASVHNSNINHSKFAALRLKDAIADAFVEKYGKRPNVDRINPDLQIGLRVHNNRAYIRIDTSGGALHRRGYRKQSIEAPMRETLAAAIVELSEWDGTTPLYDPFCGSGTILCEALMKYCRIPSGYLREKFGFETLPEFDANKWNEQKKQINARIRDVPKGLINGSDVSGEAVRVAAKNTTELPGGSGISLVRRDYKNISELKDRTIITNPPYGLRLHKGRNMEAFIGGFGDFLKQHCTGTTAWVYFGKRELIKSVGLKTSMKIPLRNGKLDGRLVRYDMY